MIGDALARDMQVLTPTTACGTLYADDAREEEGFRGLLHPR